MKNKSKIISLCIVILVQSCSSKNETIINKKNLIHSDSVVNKQVINKQKKILMDSLPIYADTKVRVYKLDSIIAEVTFINNWSQSVWLYKPILPTDSLVENSFEMRVDKDLQHVAHIPKQTDHKYLFGDQDFLPTIEAVINDDTQLELMPGTRLIFTTNLSKHYDFKQLDKKSAKAVFVFYDMRFPYIKDKKQVLVVDPKDGTLKSLYFSIRPKNYKSWDYYFIGEKVVLPDK